MPTLLDLFSQRKGTEDLARLAGSAAEERAQFQSLLHEYPVSYVSCPAPKTLLRRAIKRPLKRLLRWLSSLCLYYFDYLLIIPQRQR